MKVALYKRIVGDFEWEGVDEATDYMEEGDKHVRLSEIVELDFKLLPPEDTIQKQVDALNKTKEAEVLRHLQALAILDEKISKLQAITYQPDHAEHKGRE